MRRVMNGVIVTAFLAFVGVYVFLVVAASQQIPAEQHAQRANATQGQPHAPVATAAVGDRHTAESAENPKTKESKAAEIFKEFFVRFFELKLTDALIAIFTVVLAYKTAGLFTETAGLRAAADQQDIDMKASLVATQDSAKAAQKAADVAEAALVVAERPYLVPRQPQLKMFRFGHPGMPPVEPPEWVAIVEYGFLNLGRSVAFLKEVTVELIFEERLPEAPKYSVDGVRTLVGHFPVKVDAPYMCPTYGVRMKISGPIAGLIQKDDLKKFFYGYVRYTDIFGYLHTDGFCFRFLEVGDGNIKESTCAIVAGNSFNYSRTEKIPLDGLEAINPQGSELSSDRIAELNRVLFEETAASWQNRQRG